MRPFLTDNPSRSLFCPVPTDWVDARVLAAGAAERHAIPPSAKYIVFSATANFYAKFGTSTVTATVPAGDVSDGSGSELNPEARALPADVTHVSLVAPAAAIVTMSFYS